MAGSQEDFDAIDTDGDGSISAAELKASLADDEGDDKLVAWVTEMADTDGDKKISFEEYMAFFG